MAISSPLLETSINGARGVLINITGSMDIGLEEVETAANLVQEAAHPDANIIFGAAFDEGLEDEIRVTVIATGFDEDTAAKLANEPFTEAKAKVEEQPAPAAPLPLTEEETPVAVAEAEPAAEPAPAAEEKSSVSDEDWDILQKIFSRRN